MFSKAVALLLGASVEGHDTYRSCGPNEMKYVNSFGHQECLICPAYTRPYYDGTTCLADTCPSGYHTNPDGTCGISYVPLPPVYHTPVYPANYRTVYCPAIQIYTDGGYGCAYCPDFTRPTGDQSYCHYDSCDGFSKQTMDGRCEAGPSGF